MKKIISILFCGFIFLLGTSHKNFETFGDCQRKCVDEILRPHNKIYSECLKDYTCIKPHWKELMDCIEPCVKKHYLEH